MRTPASLSDMRGAERILSAPRSYAEYAGAGAVGLRAKEVLAGRGPRRFDFGRTQADVSFGGACRVCP